MTLKIKSSTLAALLLCASKKDVRYYLQGVYLTTNAAGRPVAVSTDGKRLLAVELEAPSLPFAPRIIPREALEQAAKAKGEVEIDLAEITLPNGVRIPYQPIDGRFPQYNRILPPADGEGGEAVLESSYVADFAKVAQLLTGIKGAPISITTFGTKSAALVRFATAAAVGVVMPMQRGELPDFNRSLFEEAAAATPAAE
jgi:DNA polymerase III sliding clamp (beta) subunit (PCNA family)